MAEMDRSPMAGTDRADLMLCKAARLTDVGLLGLRRSC